VESVPDAYKEVFKLIVSVAEFDQDIISMLGFYSPQTYLILLQNTAESRPNGGFF